MFILYSLLFGELRICDFAQGISFKSKDYFIDITGKHQITEFGADVMKGLVD